MNLKNINEKEILKSIENDNFLLDEKSEMYIKKSNNLILPIKNKEGMYAFVKLEKEQGKIVIQNFQEFDDEDFKNKTIEFASKVEEFLKEKKILVKNLCTKEKEILEEEIKIFLDNLTEENINKEKYTVKGSNAANFLIELKELGYIEMLYSSDINEVTVQFKKTADIMQGVLEGKGLALKKLEPKENKMSLEDLFKFARIEK